MPTIARSSRRVLGALLFALVVMLAGAALFRPGEARAGSVASAGSPARVSVTIPPAAVDARIVMLELGITARQRQGSAHLGAVVRLTRPDGSAVELGRITVRDGGEQLYQLNASNAVRRARGGSTEVEVELIDRGGGGPMASGAGLSVNRARIVTR